MKLPRKNKRGPIAGKPQPYKAKIVRMVNQGMSQSEIEQELEMPDKDAKRKIRRIIRELESACVSRDSRRIYEYGINKGRPPEERLTIFSTDYDAHVAFPELVQKEPPRLVTKEELFEILDATQRDSIAHFKAIAKGNS